ncbi:MAG: DUF86 domain-containing protein [Anaerolineae bacterium]|nr:DUF86 domain-containing protein [Anaerolineae bacterium]
MKRKRTHVDYLLDILDNVEKVERFTAGITQEKFEANDEKVYAVIHALQTIGEAARHLPRSLRQRYADVPWDDIMGMRDIVVHEYFGVDLDIIWQTVQRDLAPLQVAIRKILAEQTDGNSMS